MFFLILEYRDWFYSADVVIAVVCLFYSDQFSSSEGGLTAWKS